MHIITLYSDCLKYTKGTEEDFQRNNAFLLYDHIWPHPITGTPTGGS